MKIDLFGDIIQEVEETKTKVEKPSPFSFISDIANKKYPDDFEGFNSFITNLSFSQRKDTIFFANEMNKNIEVSSKQHFDFYFYALPKKNYFSKWSKSQKEDLECIKSYFGCSQRVAKQYDKTLKDEEKKKIKEWFDNSKGGK